MDSEVNQLHLRAIALAARFEQGGSTDYIDEAIDLDRKFLEFRPHGHAGRAASLTWLAIHLGVRYERLGSMGDLEEVIVCDRETLDLCPRGHPSRATALINLVCHLSARYHQLGATGDLDEAIELGREALDLCPKGHVHRFASLNNLSVQLSLRYNRLGGTEDLDAAIVLEREALGLRTERNADRSTLLSNLAVHLSTRYNSLGVMANLDEAIVLTGESLEFFSAGHPQRVFSLQSLALCLFARYKQLGLMEDLKGAIILDQQALDLTPKGHPERSSILNNLAGHMHIRYSQIGCMDDLEESIHLGRESLNLCPAGYPDRSKILCNLANSLLARYQRTGVVEDIEESINLGRKSLGLCPVGHPDRSNSLDGLGAQLFMRHKQLGVVEDLSEAIVLNREALELRPQGHPDRSTSLERLALCLYARHKQIQVMEDLTDAIVLSQDAVDLQPNGHPGRSSSLRNLAVLLFTRHQQFGDIGDLNMAITLDQEALELCPKSHPERPAILDNVAAYLTSRYRQLVVMEDIDEATVFSRESLDLRPQGHCDLLISLNNLACCLTTRYNQFRVMEDLEEAIVLGQQVLDLSPKGHRDRSMFLTSLARRYHARFADQEGMFSLYAQLVDVTQIVSSEDLDAAREWIFVAEAHRHSTILLAYETSLRLLVQHLATLPSLPRHLHILKNLTSSLAVDAFSACLRNHSLEKGVELLEQGRGVFWSQLTRLRSPLDAVIASGRAGKKLADEFVRLTSLIRHTLHSTDADQHDQLFHLNLEMQKVATDIRGLPGCSRFLLPPLFSDLRQAANEGPIIIVNGSKHSCDALIVLLDRDPVHIPLQVTQPEVRNLSMELHVLTRLATRDDVTKELATFLRKLWDLVVSPIIDFLRTSHPIGSRIWWCPTAEFSVLPLHAAGPYRKGQQNLANLYISSYTPTLTALRVVRAGRQDPSGATNLDKRFVAIGQAQADGESELVSVGTELDNIERLVRDFAAFTRLDGAASRISRVVDMLGQSQWVHFACHGLPNRTQPFESGFALQDGRLTIERLIQCDLKDPEFAYLSACHTTVGDEESPDEVIHLASAMQFIGFRSVIGTMWAVDDGATGEITSMFYRHMVDESGRLDHTRAALALNKTMKSVKVPLDQRILYIHLGA